MPKIEISVGRSLYKIDCGESEKENLLKLANRLNERVNKLSFSMRNVDERTILITAALMMESELAQKSKVNSDDLDAGKITEEDVYDAVSESMENVADYLEKLANKIKNY